MGYQKEKKTRYNIALYERVKACEEVASVLKSRDREKRLSRQEESYSLSSHHQINLKDCRL
jgi:hypothetical protein